jgi:hypothetical protein
MLLAMNGIHCDFQLSGGVKNGPLEVKKEQKHCTKVTSTGLYWGIGMRFSFGIETGSFKEG